MGDNATSNSAELLAGATTVAVIHHYLVHHKVPISLEDFDNPDQTSFMMFKFRGTDVRRIRRKL